MTRKFANQLVVIKFACKNPSLPLATHRIISSVPVDCIPHCDLISTSLSAPFLSSLLNDLNTHSIPFSSPVALKMDYPELICQSLLPFSFHPNVCASNGTKQMIRIKGRGDSD